MKHAATKNKFREMFANRKPIKDHWMDVGCGIRNGHISLTINARHKGVAVEFYIPNDKQLYNKLLSARSEIEGEIGCSLDWQPLETKDASRIIMRNPIGDFREFNESQCMGAIKWMLNATDRFVSVFKKYAKLKR